MSKTVRIGEVKFRNDDGTFSAPINAIAAEATDVQLNKIQTKGQEVLASIPDDYSSLSESIVETKEDLMNLVDKVFAPNILVSTSTKFYKNQFWSGRAYNSDAYSYFEFPVKSGTTYISATDDRFAFLDNTSVDFVMYGKYFKYTATNDGIMRMTVFNNDRARWAVCTEDHSIDSVGTYDHPVLADSIIDDIKQEAKIQHYSSEKYVSFKKGLVITYFGTFDSFTSLVVGTKINSGTPMFRYIVDDKKVYFAYPNYGTWVEMPHGLTISRMIGVRVELPWSGMCKITVTSESGSFESTVQNYCYQYNHYTPYAELNAVNGMGKFSATCKDLNKKIYLFGDSYLSQQDSRWISQCIDRDNALINAYPGQQSATGKIEVDNVLSLGRPKYLVWLYGMNDGSDTNENTPSAAWMDGVKVVLELCAKYRIIPVFGTIPNVPNINHKGKNKWIRESGYRYVDFANAVGSESNSSWYPGLLSEDNVHPTVLGAKVLCAKFYNDFPEISITD